MNTYQTTQVAKRIGIHPNTVRLYEEFGLISRPERRANGYRVFTDLHIAQFQLARIALKAEVLQNGLRKTAVTIIKHAAAREFDEATCLAKSYLSQIKTEQNNAEEAINIARRLLPKEPEQEADRRNEFFLRKEAADLLNVTIDTLRNWELNGLLAVKRKCNGYRVYTDEDIKRLKIIKALRCANYSLAAILRMLKALSDDPTVNIRDAINTPSVDDDVISVCDHLITVLREAEKGAEQVLSLLKSMKEEFS